MCRRWFLCCRTSNRVDAAQDAAQLVAASIGSLGSMTKSQSENSLMSLHGLLKLQQMWKEKPTDSDVFATELLGIENELHILQRNTETLLAGVDSSTGSAKYQQNMYDKQSFTATIERIGRYISMITVWRQFLASQRRAERSLSM